MGNARDVKKVFSVVVCFSKHLIRNFSHQNGKKMFKKPLLGGFIIYNSKMVHNNNGILSHNMLILTPEVQISSFQKPKWWTNLSAIYG